MSARAEAAMAPARDERAHRLGIPEINPHTGLSTDYLNHFSEAIMMVGILPVMPECLDELMAWRPKTYSEHFATSHFTDRGTVIAAYEAADPAVRSALDAVAETLNKVMETTRATVAEHLGTPAAEALAKRAVAWLNPLIARLAAIINGAGIVPSADDKNPQAAIDTLFRR